MTRVSSLYDIALQYISELQIVPMDDEIRESARPILMALIDGKITSEAAKIPLAELFNEAIPLDRINKILNVPDEPLPAAWETSRPRGNSQRKNIQPWTDAEDIRLIAGLHRCRDNNWTTVAEFVGNSRTRGQCQQRWKRKLDPHISLGAWTESEEKRLVDLVVKHGVPAWVKIAQELGNRSDVQCRYRYRKMQRYLPTQCQPTPAPAEVKHLTRDRRVPAPAPPTLFDSPLRDSQPVLPVESDGSLGSSEDNFFGECTSRFRSFGP
jgi:hypothetical protein